MTRSPAVAVALLVAACAAAADERASPDRAARVERREVEDFLEWPGTVRSRTTASVAPKATARVLEMKVEAGDAVEADAAIAVLDDRDLRARAGETRAALASAEAEAERAEADRRRIRRLFEQGAASKQDLERVEAAAAAAGARVEQARATVAAAGSALAEATLRAPFRGVVAERLAEPGDLAGPGRPVATLFDATRLRLEARVPETFAAKASVGAAVKVRLDTPDREVEATVEEIVPVADPQSLTFLLRAALPAVEGLKPGASGRFAEPGGRRTVLLVPRTAVARAGQVESVRIVAADGLVQTRPVRTGKAFGDALEVLSGLREGESVLLPGSVDRQAARPSSSARPLRALDAIIVDAATE